MATSWRNRYVEPENINNGNELQNGDDILAEHVNTALENGFYIKGLVDQHTTDITGLNGRITTLELKKLYTHNISISTNNATASGGTPTGWTFDSLFVEFQVISLANYNLITKQRVTTRVVSNSYFVANGLISFVDSDTGTKFLTATIVGAKFDTSGNLIVQATMNVLSSNVVTSLVVEYTSSNYTINDSYKEIS